MACLPTSEAVPSRWNSKDRYPFLEVNVSCLKVTYVGQGRTDADAAAIRADASVPTECGIFYFETTIVDRGREGFIGIGYCAKNVNLNRLPGWERGSYGYHGDDGNAFRGCGTGMNFGPSFSNPDIIGCLYNLFDRSIAYTKNGKYLGVAFANVPPDVLFPTVGMRTRGEIVESNFGESPFAFNYAGYCTHQLKALKQTMMQTSIPRASTVASDLVMSYLLHCGFTETALKYFKERHDGSLDSFSEQEWETLTASSNFRLRVRSSIMRGDMEECLKILEAENPTLLANEDAMKAIYEQQFLEMFHRPTTVGDRIEFARTFLRSSPAVLSVLAYTDPINSPLAHFFSKDHREATADAVNACLLIQAGQPQHAPLESIFRQLNVVVSSLVDHKVGSAAPLRHPYEWLDLSLVERKPQSLSQLIHTSPDANADAMDTE